MAEATVQLPFEPRAHQRAAHAFLLTFRFLVLVWHRRAGKTVFAIVELLLGALRCTKERGRFGYICPLLRQAKTVAWEYLKHFAREVPGCRVNEAELWVELPNGARIQLFGADNPDSMRGIYLDGAVLDEVAQMKPNVWGEIIRPAIADRLGWVIFIGTPKGVNLFSQLFYAALKGLEGWVADLRRASETGVIPAEELEHARKTMSPQQYAQEFDCDFEAAVENTLLALTEVLAAQERTLFEAAYTFAPKVLGVDVARYGDDRSVIFPRQGLAAMTPKPFRHLDTMELAAQVAMSAERWRADAIFVDLGGIGAGVVDRLTQLGFSPIGVNFGGRAAEERFENKRAEMWNTMADWVKGGGCLPNVPELVADLTAPTFTYANKRGRFALESKDAMRARGLASPDFGDALAVTFAAPVAIRAEHPRQDVFASRAAQRDWDPFEEGRA